MANECKFCELTQTKNCPIVYDNEYTFAFMDKAPVNRGHVLVIPKKHVSNFEDLDDQAYVKVMLVTKQIASVVKKITKCKKVGILIAGFDIPHTHIHVIPMFDIKDVCTRRVIEDKFNDVSSKELAQIAQEISNELAN